jgi:hypothetical protein
MVAYDRAFAVIANSRAAMRAPATVDPHVTATAALPVALHEDVANALALPASVRPIPALAVAVPAALDEHETGTYLDDACAWWRWLLLDFDDRHRFGDMGTTPNHTTNRRRRDQRDESKASKSVLHESSSKA